MLCELHQQLFRRLSVRLVVGVHADRGVDVIVPLREQSHLGEVL